MKQYRLKNITRTHDILYVTLEPRRTSDRLQFYPGQYATIGFKTVHGRRSPMRCFSIASSPVSPDELQFAMRLGGLFTQSIAKLSVGTDFFVQGPFGEFVIDDEYDRRVVLLAGGIGVTPFMSMIRTACRTGSNIPITLLYSYRSGHSIPFLDELQELASNNSHLKIAVFVTDRATVPNTPRILSGKISEDHIDEVTNGQYLGSSYFICGPKGFMANATGMLKAHNVPEAQIMTESFTQTSKIVSRSGYSFQTLTYAFASIVLIIGIGSIAYLDLNRYVQASDKVKTTSTSQITSSSDSKTSSSTSDTSTSNTAGGSSTTSTTSQQSYQAPTTSVS
jgi:ferredoxin-NADP reductase